MLLFVVRANVTFHCVVDEWGAFGARTIDVKVALVRSNAICAVCDDISNFFVSFMVFDNFNWPILCEIIFHNMPRAFSSVAEIGDCVKCDNRAGNSI